MLTLLLLLACGLGGRVRCDTAREAEARAWSEVLDWYERMAVQARDEAASKEEGLRASSAEREAATRARASYSSRSQGGLTDMRTGEVRSNDSSRSLNRKRAAGANQRIEDAADEELLAAADWVEAARYAQALEDGAELVQAIRDGLEPLERAEELRDTTLVATAVEARLERQSACESR